MIGNLLDEEPDCMLELEGIAAALLCRWQAYGTVRYSHFHAQRDPRDWIIDPTPYAYCV